MVRYLMAVAALVTIDFAVWQFGLNTRCRFNQNGRMSGLVSLCRSLFERRAISCCGPISSGGALLLSAPTHGHPAFRLERL